MARPNDSRGGAKCCRTHSLPPLLRPRSLALLQIMDDVEERIRHFAEEAAALEGFQILADPWSPWAGVAAACVAELADDYPTQTRALFATRAPLGGDDALMHELAASGTLSGALSAARWMADSSVLVPLEPSVGRVGAPGCSNIRLDHTRPFHTAAAAAAALDNCSLPWRIAPVAAASGRAAAAVGGAATPSHGATTMAAWATGLTMRGANIVATGGVIPAVSIPFPAAAEGDMRLSARERRLRGLPVEPQPAVPPELVNGGLLWDLSHTCNPLDSALPSQRSPVRASALLMPCQRSGSCCARVASAGESRLSAELMWQPERSRREPSGAEPAA